MDTRGTNHNLSNGYFNNTERAMLAARHANRNTAINGDPRSIRINSLQTTQLRPNQTSVAFNFSILNFRPNSSLPPRQSNPLFTFPRNVKPSNPPVLNRERIQHELRAIEERKRRHASINPEHFASPEPNAFTAHSGPINGGLNTQVRNSINEHPGASHVLSSASTSQRFRRNSSSSDQPPRMKRVRPNEEDMDEFEDAASELPGDALSLPPRNIPLDTKPLFWHSIQQQQPSSSASTSSARAPADTRRSVVPSSCADVSVLTSTPTSSVSPGSSSAGARAPSPNGGVHRAVVSSHGISLFREDTYSPASATAAAKREPLESLHVRSDRREQSAVRVNTEVACQTVESRSSSESRGGEAAAGSTSVSGQSVKRALLDAETQARLLDPEIELEADWDEVVPVKRERFDSNESARRPAASSSLAVESRRSAQPAAIDSRLTPSPRPSRNESPIGASLNSPLRSLRVGTTAPSSPLASGRRGPSALFSRPLAYGAYGYNPYSNLAPGGSALGSLIAPPNLQAQRVRNVLQHYFPEAMREQPSVSTSILAAVTPAAAAPSSFSVASTSLALQPNFNPLPVAALQPLQVAARHEESQLAVAISTTQKESLSVTSAPAVSAFAAALPFSATSSNAANGSAASTSSSTLIPPSLPLSKSSIGFGFGLTSSAAGVDSSSGISSTFSSPSSFANVSATTVSPFGAISSTSASASASQPFGSNIGPLSSSKPSGAFTSSFPTLPLPVPATANAIPGAPSSTGSSSTSSGTFAAAGPSALNTAPTFGASIAAFAIPSVSVTSNVVSLSTTFSATTSSFVPDLSKGSPSTQKLGAPGAQQSTSSFANPNAFPKSDAFSIQSTPSLGNLQTATSTAAGGFFGQLPKVAAPFSFSAGSGAGPLASSVAFSSNSAASSAITSTTNSTATTSTPFVVPGQPVASTSAPLFGAAKASTNLGGLFGATTPFGGGVSTTNPSDQKSSFSMPAFNAGSVGSPKFGLGLSTFVPSTTTTTSSGTGSSTLNIFGSGSGSLSGSVNPTFSNLSSTTTTNAFNPSGVVTSVRPQFDFNSSKSTFGGFGALSGAASSSAPPSSTTAIATTTSSTLFGAGAIAPTFGGILGSNSGVPSITPAAGGLLGSLSKPPTSITSATTASPSIPNSSMVFGNSQNLTRPGTAQAGLFGTTSLPTSSSTMFLSNGAATTSATSTGMFSLSSSNTMFSSSNGPATASATSTASGLLSMSNTTSGSGIFGASQANNSNIFNSSNKPGIFGAPQPPMFGMQQSASSTAGMFGSPAAPMAGTTATSAPNGIGQPGLSRAASAAPPVVVFGQPSQPQLGQQPSQPGAFQFIVGNQQPAISSTSTPAPFIFGPQSAAGAQAQTAAAAPLAFNPSAQPNLAFNFTANSASQAGTSPFVQPAASTIPQPAASQYQFGGAATGLAANPQVTPFNIGSQSAPGIPPIPGFALQQPAGATNPFNTVAAGQPRKTLMGKRRGH